MYAERKKPTPVYQPFMNELVIADLRDAEHSGGFDRDVLLFLQDSYVTRALREEAEKLRERFAEINASVFDHQERMSQKAQAVIDATLMLYEGLKEKGDETTGVRGFAGAAGIYLNGAIVDWQTFLADLSEHIDQAVRVGHTPDMNWLSAHTYAAVAKASQAIGVIEQSLGQEHGAMAIKILEQGVGAVGSTKQDGVALALSKRLWQGVNDIELNPEAYVVNEYHALGDELALHDPLDVEPMGRSEFEP